MFSLLIWPVAVRRSGDADRATVPGLADRPGEIPGIATTARDLPTWVKLSPADPLTGYANADCIEQLGKDECDLY